ncbi:translation initiation factor IF-2 [Candidatus Dependentiae bacterium]|nr:translation initiation factor IF-2 [Candidatus Dependentiae bacterium]
MKKIEKKSTTQNKSHSSKSHSGSKPDYSYKKNGIVSEPVIEKPIITPGGKEPEIVIDRMTVAEFSEKIYKPVGEVILTLLKQGVVAAKNQSLAEKVVESLARHYGIKIIEKQKPEAAPSHTSKEVATEGTWKERSPIVVVIGHVDHGKTTLLDFIRKTRVAAKEKGGITQHLGAYEVKTGHGNIVFLDTPGHEAFSLMRARGIRVADIAILVIAADDGIMPQTVEAIKRSKEAGIQLIVALNKMDKATPAQVEVVKRQLAQHDLVPEDWGGQTVCMPISGKLGTGIDELLEVIVLQAQLLDLKANLSLPPQGYVLESKVEKGRGPVATVICHHGILKVTDYFHAGNTWGKISSLVDSYGKRVTEIYPSMPVQISGFSELPQAGDFFEVVTQEVMKKGILEPRVRPEMGYARKEGESELNLIIKTDNASSREAVVNAISKIKSDYKKASILFSGVGDISESDVMLAADTGSYIYGFHVKVESNAQPIVQKKGIVIQSFDIIYKLIEDVERLLESGKPVKMITKKIGEALVLKVFDIKGLGIIAGAQVKTGRFIRDGKVLIWRGKQKVGEGNIKGLQRDRKSVKEVHTGFECAFLVDGFDTWEVDDRVECFQEVPE